MGEEAEVGVQAADVVLQLGELLVGRGLLPEDLAAEDLRLPERLVHVADGVVCQVDAAGLDDVADGLHALVRLLDVHLVRVNLLVKVLGCPLDDHLPEAEGGFLRGEDSQDVIHKAQDLASVLGGILKHHLIHERQEEVGEDLRRDVTDG